MEMGRSERERPSLASEIIYEILSWATLGTLTRCRMVCKEWNRITGGSSFTHQHMLRSRFISGYLVNVLEKYSPLIRVMPPQAQWDLSLDFVSPFVRILASSNQGVVCCQDERVGVVQRLCVCKPTTKQFQRIPNPPSFFSLYDRLGLLVISNNPLHYKIIRWCESSWFDKTQVRLDVFDSEAWAWQPKDNSVSPYSRRRRRGFPVEVRGVFHWMMPGNKHILTIHGYNETWALQELPPAVRVEDDDYGKWITPDYKHILSTHGYNEVPPDFCDDDDKYAGEKSEVVAVAGMLGVVRKEEGGDRKQRELWVEEETGGAWRKWGLIPSPLQGPTYFDWLEPVQLNFHWTPGISNLGFHSDWEPWVEA